MAKLKNDGICRMVNINNWQNMRKIDACQFRRLDVFTAIIIWGLVALSSLLYYGLLQVFFTVNFIPILPQAA